MLSTFLPWILLEKTPNQPDYHTKPEKSSKSTVKNFLYRDKKKEGDMVLFYSSSPLSYLAVGAADSKVPMYLNRYVSRSGESFPNDDAVNKMLHHLPGQMLYMDIMENTLPLLFLRVRSGF